MLMILTSKMESLRMKKIIFKGLGMQCWDVEALSVPQCRCHTLGFVQEGDMELRNAYISNMQVKSTLDIQHGA